MGSVVKSLRWVIMYKTDYYNTEYIVLNKPHPCSLDHSTLYPVESVWLESYTGFWFSHATHPI